MVLAVMQNKYDFVPRVVYPTLVGWRFIQKSGTVKRMSQKHRILLIEDQAPMRRNIALMLKMEGYETETAENGRGAGGQRDTRTRACAGSGLTR